MMVPSRSTKTARDFALVEVIFETGDQFVARDRSGSKFADNNRARVIRNLRGLEWRRVADKGESKHCDRSVARARNIEHIARFRRNVMRMFCLLEKHNALFAERDEEILHIPFLKQFFSRANKIEIFLRSYIRIAALNSGGEKSFRAIWFHRRHSGPIDQIMRVWIGRDDFLGRARFTRDLADQFTRQKSF